MKDVKMKFAVALVAVVVLLALAAWHFQASTQAAREQLGVLGGVHEHANFALFIDAAAFNFSEEKYMSNDSRKLSRFVHLHDMDGGIIHKHAAGVRLYMFFESIGMSFNSTCLVLDDGTRYCSGGGKTLKMFVNGVPNSEFGAYEFHDLDRILISFGSESDEQLKSQMDFVPDNACIPSGKCPERGTPGVESGCGVEDNCVE